MNRTVCLLQPIRAHLSAAATSSYPKFLRKPASPVIRKFEPGKTWMPSIRPGARVFSSQRKLSVRRYYFPDDFCKSGGKATVRFALSMLIGSTRHWSCMAYCKDAFGFLKDDHQSGLFSVSDSEQYNFAVHSFLRKSILLVFLFLTVLLNWGHPIIIGAKVILILLIARPSPSSVYLFVEELRRQERSKHRIYYQFKSLYAKKVDVRDYSFFCLATVELGDQKVNLLGILGGWWILPSSSLEEAWSRLRKGTRNITSACINS